MLELDIAFSGTWPTSEDAAKLAQRAADAAADVAPELANPRLVVSLLFTGDAQVHVLNRDWRGKDKATNVLSFQSLQGEELLALGPDGPPVMLGDIALAYETCAHEAEGKGIALEHHIAHLIIHGLLHLAGFDHVHSDEGAEAMEELERAALAKLGIADPY